MRILKWFFVIVISLIAGMMISQIFLRRDVRHSEKKEEYQEAENEIGLSEKSQGMIELKTVAAEVASLTEKIYVVGQIAQDPESLSHVVASQSGIVTDCKVGIGSIIKKDEVICMIKTNGENSLLEIRAPIAGVVIGEFTKIGDKVDTVSSIYTIADLSSLSATFDVYEKDIARVKLGQKVIVHSFAYPERIFNGKITFVSPRIDETTRTIKVRALIENIDYSLKLGMFVSGELISESQEKYLVLPAGAVQVMEDKKVVFVKVDDERFQMKEVKVKAETKDEVAITEGLKEGDLIVTEGAFLLKSELLKGELEGE